MPEFRVITFRKLNSTENYIDLGDQSYGEWIVYQNGTPKYHIDLFRRNSKSDTRIRKIIEVGELEINTLIKKLNLNFDNSSKLELKDKPNAILRIKTEIIDLELLPIPVEWLDNI